MRRGCGGEGVGRRSCGGERDGRRGCGGGRDGRRGCGGERPNRHRGDGGAPTIKGERYAEKYERCDEFLEVLVTSTTAGEDVSGGDDGWRGHMNDERLGRSQGVAAGEAERRRAKIGPRVEEEAAEGAGHGRERQTGGSDGNG